MDPTALVYSEDLRIRNFVFNKEFAPWFVDGWIELCNLGFTSVTKDELVDSGYSLEHVTAVLQQLQIPDSDFSEEVFTDDKCAEIRKAYFTLLCGVDRLVDEYYTKYKDVPFSKHPCYNGLWSLDKVILMSKERKYKTLTEEQKIYYSKTMGYRHVNDQRDIVPWGTGAQSQFISFIVGTPDRYQRTMSRVFGGIVYELSVLVELTERHMNVIYNCGDKASDILHKLQAKFTEVHDICMSILVPRASSK